MAHIGEENMPASYPRDLFDAPHLNSTVFMFHTSRLVCARVSMSSTSINCVKFRIVLIFFFNYY